MKRLLLQFEAPHPEDPTVPLRFTIEAPYISIENARKGLVRQGRISWRKVRHG
jgi:hypothetical protein